MADVALAMSERSAHDQPKGRDEGNESDAFSSLFLEYSHSYALDSSLHVADAVL